jgi:proteasome lid subunit RPN8/RPN11
LARPPTAPSATPVVEQYWTLVGKRRGRIWYARRVRASAGKRLRVTFDGPWVLRREEERADVLGFFHTHPDGPPRPSRRDIRTMRAWVSCFGKPLLCVITSPVGFAGYRFDEHRSGGVALALVELFPRGILIGVDGDAGTVSS